MSSVAGRGRRESQPSYLITDEENRQLFSLIGPKCQSLATAIAQVLSADPPRRSKWTKNHTGVLCFTKDHVKRSHFFRVFCLERQTTVWEQELYTNFEYRAPRPYFHTFEGDTSRVGLNFADIDEASTFLTAVNEYLRSRAEKASRRRSQQQLSTIKSYPTSGNTASPRPANNQPPFKANQYQTVKKKHNSDEPVGLADLHSSKGPIVNKYNTLRKKSKDKHKKVKKCDIGEPMNFEHVSHAGLDANQGFSLVNVDPELLSFFASAGVSEKELNNKETREFIYSFIDKHGGREAVISEVSKTHYKTSPSPKKQAPAAPQPFKVPPPSIKPPSPPVNASHSRLNLQRETPKVPVSSIPPPPPMILSPPARNGVPPPPPMGSIPVAPSINHSAPPPPPLPVPESRNEGQAEPALPVPPPLPSHPNHRNDLMNAIREGQKLKPASETERARSPSFSSDPKSDLLGQIRAGKELKHVERSESPVPVKEITPDGIAGALARALQERSRVIHSDSESDQNDHEIDDWDDWEE